ncbi:unnamed protein product [Closterium sp. NIES-65]|nr:unnamed protein product [Closterium sp. NIES-65]
MRRDLCAHATGDLIQQLEALGIEIPPQDAGRVTEGGAVVRERNAGMEDVRQAPVSQAGDDARETAMMREMATMKNDVMFLDASFTVIASFVGLRHEEVVSAATQLLMQGNPVRSGAKAEAGGTKNAPHTPQRPSGRKRRDDSSPEEDVVRNATRVALASLFAACDPTARLLQNPLLSGGTIPHWMFTRGRPLLGVTVPAGADAWGDTSGHETVKAEEEEDLMSDTEDEEDGDDTCATKYTGVKLEKASGKFGVKILIKEGGKRRQQRLGAYTSEEEAAFAYAAGAFVLRPRDKIPNTASLSAAEKAMLRGCTKEDLQLLRKRGETWSGGSDDDGEDDEEDTHETLVLTSWAHDKDGVPFASRAFATCAKAAFKPKKAGLVMTLKVSDCVLYWEARKGRLSNSAGGNAHVVDVLKFLVKEAVERAICIRNPEYDAEREAWIWGRHGLRISACGLEHMKPAAAAQSEGIVGDDDLLASLGAE